MDAILIVSGSSCLFFIVLALFSGGLRLSLAQSRVQRSLGRTSSDQGQDNTDNTTLENNNTGYRELRSTLHRFINLFARKDQAKDVGDQQLTLAGLRHWTSAEWKVLTLIIAISLGFFAFIISFIFHLPPVVQVELPLIAAIVGLLVPGIWLKSRIKQRQEEVIRTLPDTLDLIMVSVEAGLGFDAAMMKVVEKQKGILADELNTVLQEVKIGKPRRDALKDMAKKNNVEDLSNVIAAIVQADQLGISMGNVLRNQAVQIRDKRKQRAQEAAQKAPVKIMFPLVFFIFPSLFIVILGPAFISIMDMFANQ